LFSKTFLALHDRQREADRRPRVRRAFRPNAAAVSFDDFFADGRSQSRPAVNNRRMLAAKEEHSSPQNNAIKSSLFLFPLRKTAE
jgi:hypothetical protein